MCASAPALPLVALERLLPLAADPPVLTREVAVLASGPTLDTIGATWHPYGFAIFRLGSLPGGTTLRLHVWPPFERHFQMPIWPAHSHPWDLESRVLTGTLHLVEHDVTVSPRGAHQVYRVAYRGDDSVLERTATRADARPRRVLLRGAGESSELGIGEYHEARVDEGTLAATFVVTRANPNATPTVLGAPDGPARIVFRRTPCTPPVRAAMLGLLARALAA